MSELRLDILGVQEDDEKGKAAVNNMFAKVSAHVPPLNVAMQIYLPIYQPKTQLFNCTTGMSTLRWKKRTLPNQGAWQNSWLNYQGVCIWIECSP